MNAMDAYIVRCPSCGAKNRIPAARVGQRAKCGNCAEPLKTDDLLHDKPVIVSDADFEQVVLRSTLPVLVDCWAPWCAPCRTIDPVMKSLAAQWKGRAKVCKLSIDENPITASKFSVLSVPMLLIFVNGKLEDTMTGAMPKSHIEKKMVPYL